MPFPLLPLLDDAGEVPLTKMVVVIIPKSNAFGMVEVGEGGGML